MDNIKLSKCIQFYGLVINLRQLTILLFQYDGYADKYLKIQLDIKRFYFKFLLQ